MRTHLDDLWLDGMWLDELWLDELCLDEMNCYLHQIWAQSTTQLVCWQRLFLGTYKNRFSKKITKTTRNSAKMAEF